eukprot:CAMPEP_0178383076 /NCGR_PEP_ID=MMETSP0689_2-20121128/6817_1 /TAXON_ID=160604 /ORGANISM="Amphidinium massartii, Strain CS-259" /LENGTH=134 /DNA_ID=CAMNT_0020003289 /DNA_START=473 /DNA_END=877 /DNA_ORIENTATION=-
MDGQQLFIKSTKLTQHLCQRPAGHVFQVDVQSALYVVMPIEGDDVFVRELLADLELILKALAELDILLNLLVNGNFLDREDFTSSLIERLENNTQRSGAQYITSHPRSSSRPTDRSRGTERPCEARSEVLHAPL